LTLQSTGGPHLARTACPLDCPDACSLEVTVENGVATRVAGADDRNPLTSGFICSKVRNLPRHVHGEDRIARPHRRVGPKGSGRFEPFSWDEALDLVARRLVETRDRDGGEAILPYSYGGSNGLLSQDTTDALLFRRLGASRLARTVCAAATGRAAMGLYGKMPGVALTDYEHARLIVVWGANPHASNIHLVPAIQRARENGARLVVVDPRRIQLAAQADLHLAVRPGSDVAVALAVIRELFASGRADLEFLARQATGWEELRRRAEAWPIERAAELAGIASSDLERFVELYAESSPAVVRCGWGLERNRNGGSSVAAVLALPAVAGKFGVRGGGYTLSNSAAWQLDAGGLAGSEATTRIVNMNRLGAVLTADSESPVKLLFVYNSNALATTPDQESVRRGLERDDLFTVVFDAVWTDTARYADVVLPATTFLEHDELARGYGAYALQRLAPVIPPVGESRPNYTVFAALAVRCGVARQEEIPSPAEAVDRFLQSSGRGDELRAELAQKGWAAPESGVAPVQFLDVFPRTPDRKVQLLPPDLDREAPEGLYAWRPVDELGDTTLTLISPASHRTISSTFGQLEDDARLDMHPDDAAARGITNGVAVRVANRLGEVHVVARVSRSVRPGVVSLPKGMWERQSRNGRTANALAPDSYTDLGEGACFNDARVEVTPLAAPAPA